MLSPNALTTIARARETVGTDESKDNYLIAAINLASEIVERFCNRKFGLSVYRDMILVGSDEYLFAQFPVRRLIAIDEKPLANARIDWASGILYHKVRQWSNIDYEAGYDLPGSPEYGTSLFPLPLEIENACLQLCKHLYSDDETPSAAELAGIKSVDMGDITVAVSGSVEMYIPPNIIESLSAHRKVNI